MSLPLIEVENISKKFAFSLKRGLYYGLIDTISVMCGIQPCVDKLRDKEFWALQDINFSVEKGESIGLVGCNGSGKTTLLRLISGIYPPSKGTIKIRGSIGSLIAVGAGFHPHMTGRENIFLNGSLLGMSMKDLKRSFDDIVEFAGVGRFVDSPVATYSSGMSLRLAFSVAIHCNIDILLADEILAVGDEAFKQKCAQKMRELKRQGVSLVIVSHLAQQIRENCDRIVLINKGIQEYWGSVDEGLSLYDELQKNNGSFVPINGVHEEKETPQYFHIEQVYTDPAYDDHKCVIAPGGSFSIRFAYHSEHDIDQLDIKLCFLVPSIMQDNYLEVSSMKNGQMLSLSRGSGQVCATIDHLPFNDVEVLLYPEIWDVKEKICLYGQREVRLHMTQDPTQSGYGFFPIKFSVKKD